MGKYTVADIVEGQRTMKNGAVAGYVINDEGKKVWRIISGADAGHMRSMQANRKPRFSKEISKKAAARAFNKYYKSKAYKSPKARKAAMTRDMCHNKAQKNKRTTSAYRRNPGRFDYPGLDDGSNCKGTVYQHVSRDNSANFGSKRRNMKGGRRQQQQQQQQQEQEQWEQEWEEERQRQQQQQQRRRQRQQRQRRSRNNRQ